MSRSPLAYPLNRSSDLDGGGAADLQTDIMRFMAILSLCLVAIFALVQSIPLTPTEVTEITQSTDEIPQVADVPPQPEQSAIAAAEPLPQPQTAAAQAKEAVVLTRPKWVPEYQPQVEAPPAPMEDVSAEQPIKDAVTTTTPLADEADGFTLRFESDAALMRSVAAGQVGFYAIGGGRAQRMAVSNSRISFWDASTPNSFHEMESRTVPAAVRSALTRSGTVGSVDWGVTLPGKMTAQLDSLMQANSGGSLIIGADGQIRLEVL
ncbi:MAG: hypothetical protein KJO46_09455 [Gammaproteobacteria bacterium]|nr:hypothetical protein [Gammaproteobacteria bacterium]